MAKAATRTKSGLKRAASATSRTCTTSGSPMSSTRPASSSTRSSPSLPPIGRTARRPPFKAGLCYEKVPRFSGGAYNSVVRRLSSFSDESLAKSVKERTKHSEQLLDLDSKVAEAVAKLKAKGFVSPYLKAFVVARINPLRWIQGEPPPLEEVLKTMRDRAAKFNVEKIKQEDIASSGGGAPDESD